jgi:hypothetical protein
MVLGHERFSKDRLLSYVRFYKENSFNLEIKLFLAEYTIQQLQSELSAARNERENLLKQLEEYKQGNTTEVLNKENSSKDLVSEIKNKLDKENITDHQQIISPASEFTQTVNNNIIKEEVVQKDCRSLAFFDYDVICYRRNLVIIKGSFFIKNTGANPLEAPSVCFRFTPSNIATLEEGSVLHGLLLENNENNSIPHWKFAEGEWASKAKERGEVWIRPISHLKIMPEESVSINNFQFTLNVNQYDYFTVDAFIFYNKEKYKIRSLNRIKCLF